MATIRDLRTRVTGVQKTQKITSAMKMVSAAKLARAQLAINAARPYAERLRAVLNSVSAGVGPDAHPLLAPRDDVRKIDLVVFASDRGLCAGFNSNVFKRAVAVMAENPDARFSLFCIGRRTRDHFKKRANVVGDWTDLATPTPADADEIARALIDRYTSGEADRVVLVYGQFVSALTQTPVDEPLLPFQPSGSEGGEPESVQYTVEPDAPRLLALLVPEAVEFSVFRALLETAASEHGARMTAMDSATRNTEDLIRTLSLDMNKARQASITAELIEIVSGAEAL